MLHYSIGATISIRSSDLCYAIENKIELSSEFTTVTQTPPDEIARIALVLLRLESMSYANADPNFTHIGILRKGQRVATNQIRIKVTDIIELPPTPIPLTGQPRILLGPPPKYCLKKGSVVSDLDNGIPTPPNKRKTIADFG